MNGSGQVRRRFFLVLAPLLLASIAIPTTRSDAADESGPSAAQVAEGLRTIQDIAADVAAASATDKVKAEKIDEGIEGVWSKIEDVVRGNDKDAYITFEDNFETLAAAAKAGDAKKAGGAADAIAAAVKAYVAKYPADAPAPARAAEAATPAPAGAASPAPSARSAPGAAVDPASADKSAPGAAGSPETAARSAASADGGDANLARTGSRAASALAALAGAAFALGGLALIAGARRRLPPIA